MEILEKLPFIEWIANNYKRFGLCFFSYAPLYSMFLILFVPTGAVLEIVTDRTQEGAQFCAGFGGIGGWSFAPWC